MEWTIKSIFYLEITLQKSPYFIHKLKVIGIFERTLTLTKEGREDLAFLFKEKNILILIIIIYYLFHY